MNSTDVVGFTWNADTYCQTHLPVDERTEEVGVIFAGEDWEEGCNCSVCHDVLIDNPMLYTIGETGIRVETHEIANTSKLFPAHSNRCYEIKLRKYGTSKTERFHVYKGMGWGGIDTEGAMRTLREDAEAVEADVMAFLVMHGYSADDQEMREYHAYSLDLHNKLYTFLGDTDFNTFMEG